VVLVSSGIWPGKDARQGYQARISGKDIRQGYQARISGKDIRQGYQARRIKVKKIKIDLRTNIPPDQAATGL